MLITTIFSIYHNIFRCFCLFEQISFLSGELCDTEINECEIYTPCENNSTCTDLVNSYNCTCLPGYTGINCSVDINECDLDPCLQGSTCVDEVNGFSCTCAQGYTGDSNIPHSSVPRIFIPPSKQTFSGVYSNRPVCPSVHVSLCPSVYKFEFLSKRLQGY